MLGNYRVAAQLLASRVVLSSTELEFALAERSRDILSPLAEIVLLSCRGSLLSGPDSKSVLLGTQFHPWSSGDRISSLGKGSDPLQSATKYFQGEFSFSEQ
jgi:hypothetical protein